MADREAPESESRSQGGEDWEEENRMLLVCSNGTVRTALFFFFGYLDVDSNRTEHVYHAEPSVRCQSLFAYLVIDWETYASAIEAGTPMSGRFANDRSRFVSEVSRR